MPGCTVVQEKIVKIHREGKNSKSGSTKFGALLLLLSKKTLVPCSRPVISCYFWHNLCQCFLSIGADVLARLYYSNLTGGSDP